MQDLWRALLFRDGRGAATALNDGVWAGVMAVSIPLLLVVQSQWMVVLIWGVGALAGGVVGFLQTGLRPAGLAASVGWWKAHSWPLARWLGPESALLVVQGQVVIFALVAIDGTAGVGGLSAVQAAFAPMSLLAPAITLPGLPMLSTMAVTSRSQELPGDGDSSAHHVDSIAQPAGCSEAPYPNGPTSAPPPSRGALTAVSAFRPHCAVL